MATYRITDVIVDLTVTPHTISEPKTQDIDTETNELFSDCKTLRDVEMRYEAFWNYLNFDDVVHRASEKVKVLNVIRLSFEETDYRPSDVKRLMTAYHTRKAG